MSKLTIFKNTWETKLPHYIKLITVVDRLKKGASRPIIEQLRKETDPEKRESLKKRLPNILFAGEFTHRANNALTKHSGYIVLDFDKMGDKLEGVRAQLIADPYTCICFVSPSGTGLKVVVKIPASVETHRKSAKALREYYKENPFYDHFEDEARVCYESWDENVYFNPDSKVFTDLFEEPAPEPITYVPEGYVTEYDEIYEHLKTWLDRKGVFYVDGNKHNFLVKLAGACNRFGIDRYTTAAKLKHDFMYAASPVKEQDFDKIVDRVYKTYNYAHNTSFFDRRGTALNKPERAAFSGKSANAGVLRPAVVEDDVFDVSVTVKDIIYLNDIRERMRHSFRTGLSKGTTTYYSELDERWKWKKGEVTLVTGIMNHGKTTDMLQLCLIKSIVEGTKWAIFSPEQNPPEEFYNELIHSYIGKSTVKGHINQMSEEEYEQGMDFIHEHFMYLYPEEEAPTPEYINARFLEAIMKHGVEGVIIDPFNQLDHDWGKHGRDDRYLSDFLSEEKKFALKHDVYKIIIAHPKGDLEKIKTGEYAGNYEAPDVFNLAGGAMWGNKVDNILVWHRPFYSTDKEDTTVQFISRKIKKQKLVGIPGMVEFKFDRMTNRLSSDSGCPLDKYMPVKEVTGLKPAPFHDPDQYWRGATLPVSTFFDNEPSDLPF